MEGVRPRYGRLAVALCALTVTFVAVLGGLGVGSLTKSGQVSANSGQVAVDPEGQVAAEPDGQVAAEPEADEVPARATGRPTPARAGTALVPDPTVLPKDSGSGYRVVFAQAAQRVWLVDADEQVRRTYPVSGSIYDNLKPGTYSVYSRSENAIGVDNSGTMRHFVRFTRGERAAIGFHDIPLKNGKPVQTRDQLGTPLSIGCIRQAPEDAEALWEFAPLGTTVVVVA